MRNTGTSANFEINMAKRRPDWKVSEARQAWAKNHGVASRGHPRANQ